MCIIQMSASSNEKKLGVEKIYLKIGEFKLMLSFLRDVGLVRL